MDKVSVNDIKQADTGKFDPSDFDLYEEKQEPPVTAAPAEVKKEEKTVEVKDETPAEEKEEEPKEEKSEEKTEEDNK